MAAWTRAFVLGDDSTAATLIPTLRDTVPELKPYLDRYATAASPAARHQEGAWMLLKSPGLRPYVEAGLGRQEPLGERDMMRDNWWCEIGPQTQFDIPLSWQRSVSQPAEPGAPVPTRPLAPFLTPEQQATARAELARLQAAGVATDFLSRQVMDWAKQQPDDSRIPEALSIVVILPHAGCTTDQTGSFSHAAFDLLHSRYGSTTWAKQTRYWYK
jgi:hypothetical protein